MKNRLLETMPEGLTFQDVMSFCRSINAEVETVSNMVVEGECSPFKLRFDGENVMLTGCLPTDLKSEESVNNLKCIINALTREYTDTIREKIIDKLQPQEEK